MPCIDCVAITAAGNREPYLALMRGTAMEGDLAAGDTSVGFGPAERLSGNIQTSLHSIEAAF